MNKKVHYIGLDVHKETIAVAIAPAGDTEVRNYGIIGGPWKEESIHSFVTPDGASLVRGYSHIVPPGLQIGTLRSHIAEQY